MQNKKSNRKFRRGYLKCSLWRHRNIRNNDLKHWTQTQYPLFPRTDTEIYNNMNIHNYLEKAQVTLYKAQVTLYNL